MGAHKGTYGHLLVVAGSIGRTGAAVLACLGALRSGTGLVTCATPGLAAARGCGARARADDGASAGDARATLSSKAVERIVELLSRMDAIALGPGIGLDPETREAVRMLVRGRRAVRWSWTPTR
jgi:NAD(P)H-hydrate epimerase